MSAKRWAADVAVLASPQELPEMLQKLPDTIRDKIGFKAPVQPRPTE